MENLFVPYEIALQLKEKGFDERCVAMYVTHGTRINHLILGEGCANGQNQVFNGRRIHCLSPLYQQVVDWLDEKYQLVISVKPTSCNDGEWTIYDTQGKVINSNIEMYRHDYKHLKGAWRVAIEEALKLI